MCSQNVKFIITDSMKKFVILLLVCMCAAMLNAQENVKYRISYKSTRIVRSPGNKAMPVEWNLDIGDKTAVFYCPNQRLRTKALRENPNGGMAAVYKVRDQYPNAEDLQLLWNAPEPGKFTYANKLMVKAFTYKEELPKINWQLVDSTTTICDYECQMAIGTTMGRTWKVYFTTDVPLSYGPWVLGGLPGLVLKAEDSEHLFSFEAIGVENVDDGSKVELFDTEKAIDCKREKYVELRNMLYSNPEEFSMAIAGIKSRALDEKGKPMNYEERLKGVTFNFLDK